tara:strand:- start:16804 stop:17394 length:591 start_codon:yes stop_codon:yes gene_type:complete
MYKEQLVTAIRKYTPCMRDLVEAFRKKTFDEGNDALPLEKYDPDTIIGETWLCLVGNEVAALMVLEQDHYATKDSAVARACRFHTLKKYRNHSLGAKYLLPTLVRSAKSSGYDCVYWTHDVNNKGLNAIYQLKRKPLKHPHLKTNPVWNSIQFDQRWFFQVDKKSKMMQNVYYIDLKKTGYILKPVDCVVWRENAY